METASRGGRAWGRIEALPVPVEVEEDAPLYFKQVPRSRTFDFKQMPRRNI